MEAVIRRCSQKFRRKTSVLKFLFNNDAGLQACIFIKKTQMFSCEICEIFQNTFFYRTPPVAAFVNPTAEI